MAPNPTATPDAGMTFDAAPVTTATPVSNTAASPAPDAGMTFDSSPVTTATPVSNTQATQPVTAPQTTISATLGSMPNDPMAAKVALWSANVQSDLKNGTAITPVGKFLKAMGAHGFDVGNSPEVGEFMGSLPLGLLKAVQGRAEMVQPGQRWQGLKDTTGGLLDAGTIPSAFLAPEAGEATSSGIGKAADAVAGKVGNAADRIGSVIHSGAIQDTLQNTIREAINGAAKDANVPESSATSIRDVAKDVSDSMLQSARKDYGALDQATGGRVQRFTDAIKNVQQKLRDIAGLDPDVEGSYIEKLNTAQDAHDAAMKEAEDAGLPKGLIDRANSSFKQSKAMLDLSKQIQASSEGLRPEMAEGAKRAIPETVNPAKLNPRLDKMINSGRIQQAIGPERTTALRTAANDAHADTQTVQSLKAMAKKYIPYAALGIPGMYEVIHHLTGE